MYVVQATQCYLVRRDAKWKIPRDMVKENLCMSQFHYIMQGAPNPNRETGNNNEASHQCKSTRGSYNLEVGDKHWIFNSISVVWHRMLHRLYHSHFNLQHNGNTSLPLVCVLSHWWPSARHHNKFWNMLGISTDSWHWLHSFFVPPFCFSSPLFQFCIWLPSFLLPPLCSFISMLFYFCKSQYNVP